MTNFKKTIVISIFSLSGMLLTNSCGSKFLDRNPQGAFSPDVIATNAGIEKALLGAYAMLDGVGISNETGWHGAVSHWAIGGLTSDDAHKGTDAGDQPEQTFLETYNWQSTNLHLYGKWRALYDGVARANNVLINIPLIKDPALTEKRKTEIIAEAKFLRGHYHFEAKKMWDKIPYIDEKHYDPSTGNSVKVKNDVDAWPLIEADFQFAIDNLPADGSHPQGDVGRATMWAATAYLAKVKMFQAFPGGNANAAKLTEAKALLDKIVNGGNFSLTAKYSDNFDVPTRNNSESIFEVQYAVSAAVGDAANQGDALAYPYTGPWGCCGFYQPSHNLVDAFKTGSDGLPLFENSTISNIHADNGDLLYTGNVDPRLDWTVGRPGILYRDYKIHNTSFIRDLNYAGPFSPKKHVPSKAYNGIAGWTNLNANNYRLIRYSMVLLWLAECEVEVGSLSRAMDLVNMIRLRAANPKDFVQKATGSGDSYTLVVDKNGQPVAGANYLVSPYKISQFSNKVDAQKAVRFEIRLETAMEGHRRFDLVRWGIAQTTINTYLATEGAYRIYLAGKTYSPNNDRYPIPYNAIVNSSLNGAPTLKQNDGY